MLIVITGGSNSGKSVVAEGFARKLYSGRKVFLATLVPTHEEDKEKIEKHRSKRQASCFQVIEQGTHIENLDLQGECCVLIENMGELLRNEMYNSCGVRLGVADHIMDGIRHVKSQAEHLIVVTNEIFSDVIEDSKTRRYVEELGILNLKLAEAADIFIEVVYGIPICIKGAK
ncbi:MAG: bifunctional adenosylcobinamide kinase/adenosylcobinamide-phosphate guanylyltransferase [Lachnospiraceae bacterium]|nr:bifunctional adenosylcobinamide kinase/adenosylcobinamide-phosphate guanylyltransferase [Lachnospiraceae bacterium]